MHLRVALLLAAAASTGWADDRLDAARVIFADAFGPESRGERQPNRVIEPPPVGLGYWSNTPFGYTLRHWTIADAEPDGPRRGFWCIPEHRDGVVQDFMRQAGRSHDSIAFAGTPVPADVPRYTVRFRQWAEDNDYIGYIVGASAPVLPHDGVEFGYARQLPGTDETVEDAHVRGALGQRVVAGEARMRTWVEHRIEVDGTRIRWFQGDTLMAEGTAPALRPGGYFGIRQRYERGTRYDDVVIEAGRPSEPAAR